MIDRKFGKDTYRKYIFKPGFPDGTVPCNATYLPTFPELQFCDHDYKAHRIATLIFPNFIRHGDADVRLLNYTYDRSRTGTEDGCPVGWIECSFTTCYPLDGSQCCSSTRPHPPSCPPVRAD